MNMGKQMKTQQRHLVILMLAALLGLGSQAMAYTLTIDRSGSSGTVKYKKSSSSTWTTCSSYPTTISNVANGTSYDVRVDPITGYDLSRWARIVNGQETELTYFHERTFTVNSDYNLKVFFAAAWEGDLENGVTYTVTSAGSSSSDLSFKVTASNTSSPFHNKTYYYIKQLNVKNGVTATIQLQNQYTVRLRGTIRAYSGGTLRIKEVGANRTLQRFFFNGNMIKGDTGSPLDLGNSSTAYRLILFSGAEFKNRQDNTMWDARGWNVGGYGRLVGSHRGIGRCIEANGNLTMNYVTIQGVYNDGSMPNGPDGTSIGYKIGGGMYCVNTSATTYSMSMSNVTIQGC